MDPNTGRLRALTEEESSMLSLMKSDEDTDNILVAEGLKGLEELPEELNKEAQKELAGRKETFIDLKSDTPLARWAAKRRVSSSQKKKRKRKIVKQSRKINRKK